MLQEGVRQKGLLVPQQSVFRDGAGKPVAYVVNAEGVVEQRALVTDRAVGDQWLISSGLKEGERLVVDGLQRAVVGPRQK